MFVNFSNHPSDGWGSKQKEAALLYGEITDVAFPEVSASGNEEYIQRLAEECIGQIMAYKPKAVLCQGEFCLAFEVITRLKAKGITVLAACSERRVTIDGAKKTVLFEFEQFRRY